MKVKTFFALTCIAILLFAATAHSLNTPIGDSDSPIAEFRVIGIALSDRLGQTLAILEMDDGRQRFISEGNVLGKLRVRKILSDRVVFDTMWGERTARLNSSYFDVTQENSRREPIEPFSVQLPPTINEKTVELDAEKVRRSLADTNEGLRQVNIRRVSVYDEPIGIQIYPITSGSIFEQLGLETGDVITAVNGIEIRRPEEAVAFLEQIQAGGDFNVSVRGSRRDKDIQLVID